MSILVAREVVRLSQFHDSDSGVLKHSKQPERAVKRS